MIGRPGAGLLPLRGHSNVQGIGTIGVKPVLAEEIMARMEEAFGVTLPREAGYDTMAGMKAAARGEIDCALLMGGNLYEANPNSGWARAAFEKIGFKLFLTTTLNRGHVHGIDGGEALILPVTARDEEWQPTTQESMFNYVRLSDGGIHRLDGVRPETVILTEIARRLLPDCPVDFTAFQRHQTVREAIAKIVPGMEELADIDVAKREFHIKGRILHEPRFHTWTAKRISSCAPCPPRPAPASPSRRCARKGSSTPSFMSAQTPIATRPIAGASCSAPPISKRMASRMATAPPSSPIMAVWKGSPCTPSTSRLAG